MTAAPAGSTAPTSTATPNRQERVDGDVPSVGLAAAWALGGCLGVSLLLLLVATVGGAELEVVRADGRTVAVTASTVVVTVLLAVLAGTVALGLVGRRSRRAWTAVAVGGLAVGVVSVLSPLTSEGPAWTLALLASMHVLCGLVWCTVLVALLRRG